MRKIKWSILIASALIIGTFVFAFTYVGNGKIDEGTYHVKGYEKYKDAYITVKGDNIQFSNIDLNAIYRKEQEKEIADAIKTVKELGETVQEPQKQDSDFNYYMVQNEYTMDYSDEDAKTGSFSYTYFCKLNRSPFFLGIIYDSLHKTIHIENEIQPLMFEK